MLNPAANTYTLHSIYPPHTPPFNVFVRICFQRLAQAVSGRIEKQRTHIYCVPNFVVDSRRLYYHELRTCCCYGPIDSQPAAALHNTYCHIMVCQVLSSWLMAI